MKNRVLCSLAIMLLASIVIGGIVPQDLAKKAALNFYFQKHNQFEGVISMDEIGIISTYTQTENGIPFYHVFHFDKGGFVVVSAEDFLHPIIGYSFDNEFDIDLNGPAIRGLMHQYKDMVSFLRKHNEEQRQDVAESWKIYLSDNLPPIDKSKDWGSVGPLLTTLWDQGTPYNNHCPEVPSGGNGGHAWAGCVATVAAQIAFYHRWPDHGQGSTSYIPEDHPEYGVQSADFENTWYRWNEMSDEPENTNNAIAQLFYHIGVGYHMEYGPNGSYPGLTSYEEDSISYYFKLLEYWPDHYYLRDLYSYEQWISILKDNIDRKLPVYYAGGNHAFVCDGYQDSAYFHFNLGWSGQSNGYYHCDSVLGYTYNIDMITERYPDTLNFSYPIYPSGADTLTYIEGSIEDGSGPVPDYLNNHYASWLLDPQDLQDSVTNIEIEFKRMDLFDDGDRVYVYDGNDNTDPLLAEFSGMLPSDSAMTTTSNQAFVEFITDGSNTSDGFYLTYYTNRPEWCSGTTQLSEMSGTFDDGSGEFFYNNNKNCFWDIDPGIICPSLELSFNYFLTEDSADILYVYDLENNELLAELSGEYTTPPPPVVSPSGKMKLIFKTNKCCRNDGWEVTYHMVDIEENHKPLYSQVRPNPAHDRIHIAFTLYDKKQLTITLFDIAGQQVRKVYDGTLVSGTYDMPFNIESLKAGTYFCRIQADGQVETRKLAVIR